MNDRDPQTTINDEPTHQPIALYRVDYDALSRQLSKHLAKLLVKPRPSPNQDKTDG